MEKYIKSFLISVIFIILCISIITYKIFYPYHRIIAISIYIISWIIYYFRFRKNINAQIKESNKLYKKYYDFMYAVIGFLILFYVIFVIFPINNNEFLNKDINEINIEINQDIPNVIYTIKNLDESYNNILPYLNITEKSSFEDHQKLKKYFKKIILNLIVLENYHEKYQYFYQIDYLKYKEFNINAFSIAYSSDITKYKTALMISKNTNLYSEKVLNEKLDRFDKDNIFII